MLKVLYRRFLARFSELADDARLTIRETELLHRCEHADRRVQQLEEDNADLNRQLHIAQSTIAIHEHEINMLAAVNLRSLEWMKATIRAEDPTESVTNDGSE